MNLTNPQLATLKAAILAETDPTFVGYRTAGHSGNLAAWLNADSSPAFIVWKTSLSLEAVYDALVWTDMAARTAQQLTTFQVLLMKGAVEPNKVNVRQAFADLFAGTATLTNLTAAAKRTATKAERIFATGTGSNGSPGTLVAEGALTVDDINAALRS